MIKDYFNLVRSSIDNFGHIIEERSVADKMYSEGKGFIDGKLTFIDESILEFSEVRDIETTGKNKYRYHYRDQYNNMIFRYDNAKHHPEIQTFPHHKHLANGTVKSDEPDIETVLYEIEKIVLKK